MKDKDEDNYRRMRTKWGKRRGWELQRLVLSDRKVFWRLSFKRGGCRPATEQEIRLWRLVPENLRTSEA